MEEKMESAQQRGKKVGNRERWKVGGKNRQSGQNRPFNQRSSVAAQMNWFFGQFSWNRFSKFHYIDSCDCKCQLATQSLHFPPLCCLHKTQK
jgi:hypothetical protein